MADDEGAKAVYDKQCREDYMWPQDVITNLYEINELALSLTSAAPAVEAEAAPADEPTDAPASDSSSVTPTTGNSSAAAIAALLAASGSAVIISGKRRK